jgi:hypothetical protein
LQRVGPEAVARQDETRHNILAKGIESLAASILGIHSAGNDTPHAGQQSGGVCCRYWLRETHLSNENAQECRCHRYDSEHPGSVLLLREA